MNRIHPDPIALNNLLPPLDPVPAKAKQPKPVEIKARPVDFQSRLEHALLISQQFRMENLRLRDEIQEMQDLVHEQKRQLVKLAMLVEHLAKNGEIAEEIKERAYKAPPNTPILPRLQQKK